MYNVYKYIRAKICSASCWQITIVYKHNQIQLCIHMYWECIYTCLERLTYAKIVCPYIQHPYTHVRILRLLVNIAIVFPYAFFSGLSL